MNKHSIDMKVSNVSKLFRKKAIIITLVNYYWRYKQDSDIVRFVLTGFTVLKNIFSISNKTT